MYWNPWDIANNRDKLYEYRIKRSISFKKNSFEVPGYPVGTLYCMRNIQLLNEVCKYIQLHIKVMYVLWLQVRSCRNSLTFRFAFGRFKLYHAIERIIIINYSRGGHL